MPLIDALFDQLLGMKGSDLHLGIGYPPLARARGELVAMREDPIDAAEMEGLLFEIVDERQRTQITEELDLDFAYAYGSKARFRANYFFRMTGMGAVFRTIPTKILTLADLGTPEAVRKLADKRSGLVLVTGPTGSGKSTTLAGMINYINETRPCHILTVEDPVEFVHQPKKAQVTHREVGPHVSSFATAIRSAGREDPNVILIGELRNNETMKLALQLASFGVLVFATVHTNSAAATIDRIVTAFPADEQPQGHLARDARGGARRNRRSAADEDGGREGARGGARDPRRELGHLRAHPGGEVVSDPEHHAGGAGARDADDGHGARAARKPEDRRPRGRARKGERQESFAKMVGRAKGGDGGAAGEGAGDAAH